MPKTQIKKNDEQIDVILIKDRQGKYKIWQNQNFGDYLEKPALPKIKDEKDFFEKTPVIRSTPEKLLNLGVNLNEPPSPGTVQSEQKKYSINKVVNKVNDVLSLNLDDQSKRRLKNILFSFSRHIRSLIDSIEVLTQDQANGGVGLKLIEAERLMALVKNIAEKIDQEGGLIIDDTNFSLVSPSRVNEVTADQGKVSERPMAVAAMAAVALKKISTTPVKTNASVAPTVIKPKVITKDNFSRIQRPLTGKDRQINEIKKRPQVFGPVEELAAFSLNDFRGLSVNPQVASDKILEKIELLAEESITKKSQGIKAWHQSEINKIYLSLGDQSIKRQLSIEQLIKEKQTSGETTLSLAEFEALSDLNKKLRF